MLCTLCLMKSKASNASKLILLLVFMFSCIEKWLKGQFGKCPQCNAKAHRKDIRPLFARTLKVNAFKLLHMCDFHFIVRRIAVIIATV